MSNWINLDVAELSGAGDHPIKKSPSDTLVHLILSPHDVPDAVRGRCYDGHFALEFRYLDEERERRVELEDDVYAMVGRHSHRLLSLHIPTDSIVDNVEIRIEKGLDLLRESHPKWHLNIDAAETAFEDKKDRLLQACL